MSGGQRCAVQTEDARFEDALAEVFAAAPGEFAPPFDLERLLRRAKSAAGLHDLEPAHISLAAAGGGAGGQVGPRRSAVAIVGGLLLVVLLITGALAWHHAAALSGQEAEQRAIASKQVRGPFTDVEVEKLATGVTPGIVDVETEIGPGLGGAGTGIVLSPSGEVLTNNHVINGASAVEVVTKSDQKRYTATVVGYDRTRDVALLQIQRPGRLTPAVVGDSSALRVGEPILGIGNAGGAGGKPIQAPGTIREFGTWISTSDELTGSIERLDGLILVRADIRPGDSGGPLVNEAGQVIGVNTATSVNYQTNAPSGVGFAIPIDDAMSVVQAIRAGRSTGEVHVGPTGNLGVGVVGPVLYPDGRVARSAKPGAVITSLAWGSRAEDAGLRRGDTIIGLDGTMIDTPSRLTATTGMHRPGDRLNIDWVDVAGRYRTAVVTLDEGPPA